MASEFTLPAAALFARHAIELLAQGLEELRYDRPTPSDAWRAAKFLQAGQIIALRFGESNLSPEDIARDLRISTRSLSRILAAHNQTVMRRVFDERVRQAKKLLASPESAHRSITQIAFSCGFNDSSHFGRVFMQRTEMTPSEWRRRN
jgi:AraC-like DNA-binding protein